mmetsp:Transcript_25323/g.72556  ORF Transcript_25323/g.72556 Transcript_25323/m.72556 type:complete len:151 (+) Transcript_25323:1037-1489(+)
MGLSLGQPSQAKAGPAQAAERGGGGPLGTSAPGRPLGASTPGMPFSFVRPASAGPGYVPMKAALAPAGADASVLEQAGLEGFGGGSRELAPEARQQALPDQMRLPIAVASVTEESESEEEEASSLTPSSSGVTLFERRRERGCLDRSCCC